MMYCFFELHNPQGAMCKYVATEESDPKDLDDVRKLKQIASGWDEIEKWFDDRSIRHEANHNGMFKTLYAEVVGDKPNFEFKIRWL